MGKLPFFGGTNPGLPIMAGPSGISTADSQDFTESDNGDATHAVNLSYYVRAAAASVVAAKLMIVFKPYRTYQNFTGGGANTGAGSAHAHTQPVSGAESALHNHNHNHPSSFAIAPTVGSASLTFAGGAIKDAVGGGGTQTVATTADGTASSGHTHSMAAVNNESVHTHPVAGGSVAAGVTDGAVAGSVTVLFDGVDHTADIGGPFTSDHIEIDVKKFIQATVDKQVHTIAIQPNGPGRFQVGLRIAYSGSTVTF